MTSTRAWAIAARYGRRVKRQSAAPAIAAALLLTGCAGNEPQGPAVVTTTRNWLFGDAPGSEVRSPHYRLRTTVRDPATLDRFIRVMEMAYAQYVALVPPSGADPEPLDVYLFAKPEEWEAFTRQLTGDAANVYLSVGAGGYAYGDRFVCWLFNENDLWSVATHEGFHQYVARYLTMRMPPALEEGIATTFENAHVSDRHVSIDRTANSRRQEGLQAVERADALSTVADLIKLHAGDIAEKDMVIREGFYAQCWVLARLILENPQYRDGLRRMLADLRDGRTEGVGRATIGGFYHPGAAKPLLGKYIAADWDTLEKQFRATAKQLAATNE